MTRRNSAPVSSWAKALVLLAEAERLFTKASALAPRSLPALFGLGRTALAKQEHARAVDLLEQALAIDPSAVVIHDQLATADRGMGDLAKAEAHLRVRGPGEIRPPDPLMFEVHTSLESQAAYEARGAQALEHADWAVAADNFPRAMALAPDEPSLRYQLGTALAKLGDPSAPQLFLEITGRWPRFAKAHESLGVILASGGHTREAIDEFSAAVAAEPTYADARFSLAEALRLQGRFEDSLPHYEQTIILNPRLAEARIGYGWAFVGLRQFEPTRRQFTDGARLFPDRPQFAEQLRRLPPVGSSH